MNTLGAKPTENAVILFNGKDLNNWSTRDSQPATWTVKDGFMQVIGRPGNIMTKEVMTDFYLHLEFRCPDMPQATGQKKGNSGVFLQGRYEIQVLDSYGWDIPGKGDCGAIYNRHAPLVNACKPALQWQTYDVFFCAPRINDVGEVTEPVRLTVIQNGQTIQNNVQIPVPTDEEWIKEAATPGPLMLQDHGGDEVAYRNIWAVPLPTKGSDTYEPRQSE